MVLALHVANPGSISDISEITPSPGVIPELRISPEHHKTNSNRLERQLKGLGAGFV